MNEKDRDLIEKAGLRRRAVLRQSMMRDIELTRRDLVRRVTAASLGGVLFAAGFPLVARGQSGGLVPTSPLPDITSIPDDLKGSGSVTVCSYGGAFQDAQRIAYFKPFEKLSGIKVNEAEGPDIAKVKAMVDSGNIEWDVAEFDRSSVINLQKKGDYWEEINYSLFDTANIDKSRQYKYSIDMLPYGQIISYRTDVFESGPQGWKDFWDTKKFSGPRAMPGGTNGINPFLEAALIADGVSPKELYPLDIDRAYKSLSKIKGSVVKWWDAGAQPAQMLTDKEAVLVVIWNGRVKALQDQKVPVVPQWNEGMFLTDVWAIPKGAPNRENAQKFAAFITMAIPQARLSKLINYGSVNNKSINYMTAEEKKDLVTAPAIQSKLFTEDVQWWADNLDKVLTKWNEWILE